MDIEKCASIIVDSAIKVHRELGPGLLESAYQTCFAYELEKRGLGVKTEVALPIHFDGHIIESAYRLDMLVEDHIVIENKSVERLIPIYEAQMYTYLRLSGNWLGFLINWNTRLIKDGIKRIVWGPKPE